MARHTISARVAILLLMIVALQPWPASQSQAHARQPTPPITSARAQPPFAVEPLAAANTAAIPTAHDRVGFDITRAAAGPALAAAADAPEIATLAAGLGNDPLAIYDYVHNQIDYIPSWGLLKSPRETLLSGQGNPFDQAALLAALLNAVGFTTQFVRGDIRITNQQAINLTGATDANAAIQILLAGGIQVTLDTGRLRIPHVWVRVSAGGSHDLDPSFKSYTERNGQDLHPLLGFDPATFTARAESGAVITADSIQHLNIPNIEADAASYATNLIGYLRANNPFASVEDLIGGRKIAPLTSTGYPTAPYEVVTATTAANLSNVSHSLNIRLANINYTTTTDSVDGERITVFYECATPADCQTLQAGGGVYNVNPASAVNMVPRLRVGGQIVGTGTAAPLGSNQQLDISITTPAPGQQTISFPRDLFVGGWYALPMRLQGVSNRSLARQIVALEEAIGQGLALDDERVLGQILHVLGLSYYNEVGLGDWIDARLAKVAVLPFFSVMVASRDLIVYTNIQGQPVAIDPGAHTVDVGLNINNAVSLASVPNAQDRERAWFFSAGMRGSAAEHAILEQLQPVPAISTVQILKLAAASGNPIYYITPANQSAVLPLLDPAFRNSIAARVAAGRHIVVAQHLVTYGQWGGTGWIELNPTSGEAGYIIAGGIGFAQGAKLLTIRGGGGVFSTLPSSSLLVLKGLIAMLRSRAVGQRSLLDSDSSLPVSLYNSSRVQQVGDQVLTSDLTPISDMQTAQLMNAGRAMVPGVGDPINAITGAFQYQQRDLAAFGGLGIPLGFERFSTSERHNLDGPLGYGWSHSYNMSFAISTEWERGFGGRTALEAAPALAVAQIGVDLFNLAGILQQRFAMDVIVGQWLMAQITGNAAVVTEPTGAVAAHVRLIDGTYLAPTTAANLNTVSLAADDSATLAWEDGRRTLFDPIGRPTALDDANGNRTTLSYNDQGRLSQVADPVGRTLTLSYNGQGRLSQIADPVGRVLSYTYNGLGNLQTATNPRGGVTTYAYDAAHRITTITDPVGTPYVISQYDGLGRVSIQADGRGGQTRLFYGGDHTLVIDPQGRQRTFFYDMHDRLLAVQNSLGIRQSLAYDAADHMTRLTNGLGQALAFGYDARGHLTTTTDPLNNTTVWAYDPAGNPIGFTDQRGKIWRFTYDPAHNMTGATDPLGSATTYTYNAQGQLTAIQDAIGAKTLMYDSHGNLKCFQNAPGQSSCWGYDIVGRPTQFADGSGATAQFSYDANDNLVIITEPSGGQTSYAYDGNDSLTSLTDANGHTTSYVYDAQFNLTSVTDALGGVTRYTYDAADQLTRVTDANGHATTYQYDQASRVVTIADPLSRSITFSYDNGDRLVALKRADGSTIGYSYDALGRLTGIDNPAGPDSSFSYDAAGRMITAAHGATWNVSYQYDDAGRLSSMVDAIRTMTIGYAYDSAGRRTSLRVDRGATPIYNLAYSYDAADRLTRISDQMNVPALAIDFRYDAADRLAEVVAPTGARAIYAYTAGRLTKIKHQPSQGRDVATYDYTYDATGNTTRVTDTASAGSFSTSYSYDALGRLIQERYPRYDIAYTYDSVGNMVRRIDSLATLDYGYDSANQLIARGGESFSYDPNGNLTSWQSARGTSTYSYDYQNQLTGLARTDSTSMAFSYDAFGRRLTAQGPSGTRGFLYDGTDSIIEGNGDLSQATARYLYGDGMLVARYTDQLGLTSYHGDAGENVRYLMGATGRPLDGYDYDAFGRTGAPAGVDANPFRFVGQRGVYQHDTAGWPNLQMGHRYYDPDSGRFGTVDPLPGSLIHPTSQNAYAYALNNPLSYSDPTGLRPGRAHMSRISMGHQGALVPFIVRSPSFAELLPLFPRGLQYLRSTALSGARSGRQSASQASGRLSYKPIGASESLPGTPPPSQDPAAQPRLSETESQAGWQRLTNQGGVRTLACTSSDQLFAGSFYAGLQRSIIAGHGNWGTVASAGVGELVLGGSTSYAGARYAGVLTSADGRSWTPANTGLAANDVYALAIDPGSPGHLFAGTEMGLFASDDAGANWHRPAGTVPGRVVSELAVVGGTLLAVTELGLYRSTAGGATWQRPTGDLPPVQIFTLLAGAQAGTIYAGTASGGYVSTNSGDTWSPLGTGLAGRVVHALAIDPLNGQHMVAGMAAGIFISIDGGSTWASDPRVGLEGVAAQVGALAFCPAGGDMNLYIGTGAGVYAITAQRLRAYLMNMLR